MKLVHCLLLLLSIFHSYSCFASALGTSLNKQIKNIVDQLNIVDGFNGSIALKIDNISHFTYSVGYQKPGVKLTSNHLFSSGSVGKEFTTVAILKLANEGKLQLDALITHYIPNLPVWGQNIKIKHLLNHTSGLPKINWKRDINTDDVMTQIISMNSLKFAPGTQYLYSNINVMLRAMIIENVAGLPFDQYLNRYFFGPLKMADTVQVMELQNIASKVIGDYPTAINGVTIYTTASDLLRWELALLDGRAINGKSITHFVSGHPLSGKSQHIEYDFGQFTKVNEKIAIMKHDGSNPSHHVLKYTDISHRFSFVAMSSDGNKNTLYLLKDKIEKLICEEFATSCNVNRYEDMDHE